MEGGSVREKEQEGVEVGTVTVILFRGKVEVWTMISSLLIL